VQAEARSAHSTRETALRYTAGMRITGTLTHGLFLALTSACFTCGDSKGDESSSESTGLPENEYCDNPDYPGNVQTEKTCGCGRSAVSEQRNPFYLDCVSEKCADNPDACPPVGDRAACLWDGVIESSAGSICAQPCVIGDPCGSIQGIPASCEPVQTDEGEKGLCVLTCDIDPCPTYMTCVENGSLPGFGAYYCIYDLSP